MNISLIIVVSIAGFVALGWTALGLRMIRLGLGRDFRFFRAVETENRPDSPGVTAIVPARNEEAKVEATVVALRSQEYENLGIIVIDDQSTDATASILERLAGEAATGPSLLFIRGVERPAGWVGKTWAVHQAAIKAPNEWLWFVDADMGLDPRALASAINEAEATGADLVSLLPGVRCETFWQGAIATALLQLLGHLYPLNRVNNPEHPDAIAAGGFLLVRRAAYFRAGGHEAVRKEIIEDIQLAKKVKESGGKLVVRLAPGLVWTHMYGRFGDIWKGLRKNAYAGMDYQPHKFFVGAAIALALAWAPWVALVIGLVLGNGVAIGVGVWGLIAQAVAAIPSLVFLRLPFAFAVTLPLGISAYVAIASSSVWHYHQGRILWKDRAIPAAVVEAERPS